jgi:hypothetical protein
MGSFQYHSLKQRAINRGSQATFDWRCPVVKAIVTACCALGMALAQAQPAALAEVPACPSSSMASTQLSPASISGLYKKRSGAASTKPGARGELSRKYDYLAITPVKDNVVRVQLSTVERNGHDCQMDTYASVCGLRIIIKPGKEDQEILKQRQMNTPELAVTANRISFIENPGGGFNFGAPYCGAMGYLQHAFPRSSRDTSFDPTAFQ